MYKSRIFACISIIIIFVLCSKIQNTYSTRDSPESVALGFLEQVVDINMDNYSVVSINASNSGISNLNHYQTNIRVVLSNGLSEYEAIITLADGEIWTYRLNLLSSELEDDVLSNDDYLTTAKRAISEYQLHFANDYDKFVQMISTALEAQISTVEEENFVLNISQAGDLTKPSEYTRLYWFEKISGQFAIPHRSVMISISKTGVVTQFVDNMRIYQVATTNIDISENEAYSTAMPHIDTYANENGRKVKTTEATLEFVSDITSSRGDEFLIYPQWNLVATFDEINEESVFGYAVMIWADNGEVYHHSPQGVFNQNGNRDLLHLSWSITVPVVIIPVLSLLISHIGLSRKNRQIKSKKHTDLKTIYASIMIALFCSLLIPQAVSAKSSTILGSTYNVPPDEIAADTDITDYIQDHSLIASYTTYNWYGTSTTAANMYIAAYGVGHYYSISFFIGHGVKDTYIHFWGWPWQWHDHTTYFVYADDGSHIYDHEIYDNSVYQNINSRKFVFLWSCYQGGEIGSIITYPCGEIRARGMPLAWLHTIYLSSNGYANPDSSGQTFIGFNGPGPFLTYDGLGATDACYYFLRNFYNAALWQGYYYSINAALDFAANAVWGTTFGNCILSTGFTMGGDSSRLRVYGDGDEHISTCGGGGGCPILSVWDGTGYTGEGLLDIHNPEGLDVVANHTLTTTPQRVNGKYLLKLIEHPQTISYIDQAKLYANLDNGTTIELNLVKAWHSEYGNVKQQLRFSDEQKIETLGADHNEGTSHIVDLEFVAGSINSNIVSFTFQIEGNNPIKKL